MHTPRAPVRGRSDGDRNVLAQGSFPNQLFMFSCSSALASPFPVLHIPPLALGARSQGTIQPFNSPQREIPASQQRLPQLQNLHFQPPLLLRVLLNSDTSVLSLSSLGASVEESQTNSSVSGQNPCPEQKLTLIPALSMAQGESWPWAAPTEMFATTTRRHNHIPNHYPTGKRAFLPCC